MALRRMLAASSLPKHITVSKSKGVMGIPRATPWRHSVRALLATETTMPGTTQAERPTAVVPGDEDEGHWVGMEDRKKTVTAGKNAETQQEDGGGLDLNPETGEVGGPHGPEPTRRWDCVVIILKKKKETGWKSDVVVQDDLLDEDTNHIATSRSDQTSVVLHWSVQQVKNWLEHSVPIESHRLKEVVRKFTSEGVDGLSLLTLHRSHNACVGMTDDEWLVLKVARRWLMAQGERPLLSMPSRVKIKSTPAVTGPATPQSARSDRSGSIREYNEKATLLSPRMAWMPRIHWGSTKDEQEEALEKEVQSLRGEIVGAEERETTHLAQLDHIDEVLRNSQLANYLHTRTSVVQETLVLLKRKDVSSLEKRWTALSGEPPVDDTDVDDWLLRFLVIRGSSICFYLHATDLRPQGTITRSEIVDVGIIPNKQHHQGDTRWSAFHITTCHGLRLECSSLLKLQVD